MTAVLREFERSFDALGRMFEFTAAFGTDADGAPIAPEVRQIVDLALEELFTNIVKYGSGHAPVLVRVQPVPGGLEVTVDDPDADEFDPTRSPDADTSLPLEEREPGGLGLHLIRRMLDSIEYQYVAQRRLSRVRFRKTARLPEGGLDARA
ncbi:MAG TPA: ATP-binding protein [Burkholderiaceae bacterium]|nr:ATP-binding protein [Burkholderiaceae bacterium]